MRGDPKPTRFLKAFARSANLYKQELICAYHFPPKKRLPEEQDRPYSIAEMFNAQSERYILLSPFNSKD